MGIVYGALDVKLEREVLPPELGADPERKHHFIQEANAAAITPGHRLGSYVNCGRNRRWFVSIFEIWNTRF
jgi:hypothetical protein